MGWLISAEVGGFFFSAVMEAFGRLPCLKGSGLVKFTRFEALGNGAIFLRTCDGNALVVSMSGRKIWGLPYTASLSIPHCGLFIRSKLLRLPTLRCSDDTTKDKTTVYSFNSL